MENMVNENFLKNNYSGKKVFITGHTGFKGSWLALWLQSLGATVKGYALASEYKGGLFDYLDNTQNLESVIADIRDRSLVKSEINKFKPDFIFHLAAQPLVRRSYKFPAETYDINVTGTANLLEAAKELDNPCTLVIITTDKVYKNKEQNILYKETDELGGYDPYSSSKACTELLVDSFRNSFFNLEDFNTHKKAISSVRAGNVIGGGDFSEDRIIPDIVRSLTNNKIINVRNPNAIRPWQHVLEPLGGYLLLGALLSQEVIKFSGAFNFGPLPKDHLTVKDLMEIAIKKWGSGDWEQTKTDKEPHEANLLKLDISKSKSVLNWEPRLSAEEAIEWTMDWYKEKNDVIGLTLSQINKYMNL